MYFHLAENTSDLYLARTLEPWVSPRSFAILGRFVAPKACGAKLFGAKCFRSQTFLAHKFLAHKLSGAQLFRAHLFGAQVS